MSEPNAEYFRLGDSGVGAARGYRSASSGRYQLGMVGAAAWPRFAGKLLLVG